MKFISIRTVLILILATALCAPVANAGGSKYRQLKPFVDPGAWYVGKWHGYNLAFDPPLEVEVTISAKGKVSSFAHGNGKNYRVSTQGKVIKIPHLKDINMRGKVLDSDTLMMEDDSKLEIQQEESGLQTIAPDFGIVVHYLRVEDDGHEQEIESRASTNLEQAPHHKKNHFWNNPDFWTAVAVGVAVEAIVNDDDIELNRKIRRKDVMSKKDWKELQRLYPKN